MYIVEKNGDIKSVIRLIHDKLDKYKYIVITD